MDGEKFSNLEIRVFPGCDIHIAELKNVVLWWISVDNYLKIENKKRNCQLLRVVELRKRSIIIIIKIIRYFI